MAYEHPTAWVGTYPGYRDPERLRPKRYYKRGQSGNRHPRYPFPADFLCDERLLMVIGAFVELHGLSEAEGRACAALLAGYTAEWEVAGRIKVEVRTAIIHLKHAREKLGVRTREQLVATLWPTYERFRPRVLLLPRLDPALLELEPDDECFNRLLLRIGRRAEQAAD